MSLNQPSPISNQNLASKTKNVIDLAKSKAGDAKESLKGGAHVFLPAVIVDLAFGTNQTPADQPKLSRCSSSSSNSIGIVAAKIQSATPTDSSTASSFVEVAAASSESGDSRRVSRTRNENEKIGDIMKAIDRQFKPSCVPRARGSTQRRHRAARQISGGDEDVARLAQGRKSETRRRSRNSRRRSF